MTSYTTLVFNPAKRRRLISDVATVLENKYDLQENGGGGGGGGGVDPQTQTNTTAIIGLQTKTQRIVAGGADFTTFDSKVNIKSSADPSISVLIDSDIPYIDLTNPITGANILLNGSTGTATFESLTEDKKVLLFGNQAKIRLKDGSSGGQIELNGSEGLATFTGEFAGLVQIAGSVGNIIATGDVSASRGGFDQIVPRVVDADLTIQPNTNHSGNVTVSGDLTVAGNFAHDGDVAVGGDADHSGNVTVGGDLTVQGSVIATTVSTDQIVNRIANVDLTIQQNTNHSGNVAINGDLTVLGNFAHDGDVAVGGDTNHSGNVTVGGGLTIANDLEVGGLITGASIDSLEIAIGDVNLKIANLIRRRNMYLHFKYNDGYGYDFSQPEFVDNDPIRWFPIDQNPGLGGDKYYNLFNIDPIDGVTTNSSDFYTDPGDALVTGPSTSTAFQSYTNPFTVIPVTVLDVAYPPVRIHYNFTIELINDNKSTPENTAITTTVHYNPGGVLGPIELTYISRQQRVVPDTDNKGGDFLSMHVSSEFYYTPLNVNGSNSDQGLYWMSIETDTILFNVIIRNFSFSIQVL